MAQTAYSDRLAETDRVSPLNANFPRGRVVYFLAGAAAGVAVTFALGVLTGGSEKGDSSTPKQTAAKTHKNKKSNSDKESGIAASYKGLSPRQASADLEGVLSTTAALEDFDQLKVLIDQASKFDPEASFETGLEIADPAKRRDVLCRVLRTWVLKDREAAMAAVNQMENVALRRDLMKSAIATLSGSNPAGAFAVLRATPSLRDDNLWQESFSNWAKSNPDAAVAAWQNLEHPEERGDALRGIATAFAKKNFSTAIEWAKGLSQEDDKNRAVLDILRYASESSPALAAQHIDLLKNVEGERAQEVAGRIAEEWAETDFSAAVAWTEKLPAAQRDRALREIAGDLMRYDPDAAEEMAAEIEDGDQRRRIVGEIAKMQMTADPMDAVKWIANLPPEDQQSAWRNAAYEWARTRPEEAAAFALSEDLEESARRQLIEAAAPQWARIDPASAAQWAIQLQGNSGKEGLARVVDEWSRRAPQAAIDFIAQSTEGKQQEEMTRRAVGSWSREDPSQAAEFVSGLEQSKIKDTIARDVTENWMRSDSMAASEWVGSLEPGTARDSAVGALIYRIEREDPAAAAQWAETIVDVRKRDETFKRLLRRLDGSDR